MNAKKAYSVFRKLTLIAEDISPIASTRVASAIYRGNQFVSYGTNKMKSHPLQKAYATIPERIYLHSEIDAIKNAMNRFHKFDFPGSEIIVCRVTGINEGLTNHGYSARSSYPCIGCKYALESFGIRKIWFLEDNGMFKSLDLYKREFKEYFIVERKQCDVRF